MTGLPVIEIVFSFPMIFNTVGVISLNPIASYERVLFSIASISILGTLDLKYAQ